MDESQLAKIESAVAECLAACGEVTPFLHTSAFIEKLKADPAWRADEIIEVQTRVIRILLYRSAADKASGT